MKSWSRSGIQNLGRLSKQCGSTPLFLQMNCIYADRQAAYRCSKSPKKVTAAVFSACSSLIAFADKFGDVLTAGLQSEHDLQAEPIAAPLLGHLCSIVTSLAFSPDGKHIVSTDQDCKVRVSTMPKEPQKVVLLNACSPPTT